MEQREKVARGMREIERGMRERLREYGSFSAAHILGEGCAPQAVLYIRYTSSLLS